MANTPQQEAIVQSIVNDPELYISLANQPKKSVAAAKTTRPVPQTTVVKASTTAATKKYTSFQELADKTLKNFANKLDQANDKIYQQQKLEYQAFKNQQIVNEAYKKYMFTVGEDGGQPFPQGFKSPIEGVTAEQQIKDIQLLTLQSQQQQNAEKIKKNISQNFQELLEKDLEAKAYAEQQAKIAANIAQIKPLPSSGQSPSPFESLVSAPSPPSATTTQQVVGGSAPPLSSLTTQTALEESGYNTAPKLLDLGPSNVSQPATPYQKLSPTPSKGLQPNPPGQAELGEPLVAQLPPVKPGTPPAPNNTISPASQLGQKIGSLSPGTQQGIGAGIVGIGFQLASGVSLPKAIVTTGAGYIGYGVGAAATALVTKNPYAAGVVGGILAAGAGTLAGSAYDAVTGLFGGGNQTGQTQQPTPVITAPALAPSSNSSNPPSVENIPFSGGQCKILYKVTYAAQVTYDDGAPPSSYNGGNPYIIYVWGPIQTVKKYYRSAQGGYVQSVGLRILCHGLQGQNYTPEIKPFDEYGQNGDINTDINVAGAFIKGTPDAPYAHTGDVSFTSFNVIPADGSSDTCGDFPAPTPYSIDYSPYQSALQQPPAKLGQQEAQQKFPPAALPEQMNNKQPKTVYIPPNTPAQVQTPDGKTTNIPASPNPQTITPGNNGQIQVNPNNGSSPYTLSTSGAGPATISIPGYQPITFNPDGSTTGATPNVLNPTSLVPTPLTPTSLSPNPLKPTTLDSQKAATPQTTPATQPLFDPNTLLIPGIIAGLTPILQQLNNKANTITNQTTPDALKKAAEQGTCNTLQPGGCMLPLANNAKDAADNSKFAAANTLGIAGDALATQTGLNQLKKAVGVGEFPATVPTSLVTKGTGAVAATTSIPNLARFQAWHVEQLDALMGAFAIPFAIGGKAMSIPNVAEGMAEQIGMQFASIQNQEMLLNLCTRTIAEVGQIKQQQFKTYMAVEAIIEYLSFKHKEVQHPMPMSFVPGETNLLSLLKEATQTVSVIEFDDTVTQRTFLLDLARAAAITRAQGFRQINGTTDDEIKKEILARIKGLSNYGDNLANQSAGTFGKDDLDAYIKEIMSGYPNGQNPYACEGEEPPQITRKPPKKNT